MLTFNELNGQYIRATEMFEIAFAAKDFDLMHKYSIKQLNIMFLMLKRIKP